MRKKIGNVKKVIILAISTMLIFGVSSFYSNAATTNTSSNKSKTTNTSTSTSNTTKSSSNTSSNTTTKKSNTSTTTSTKSNTDSSSGSSTKSSNSSNTSSKNSTSNTTNTTKESDEEIEKGLSSLKVDNVTLTPEFSTKVYEYTADYEGTETTLDVKAVATDPKYKVDITGNNNLKEGENVITILVEDEDGENVATYQVILIKTAPAAATNEEQGNVQNDDNQKELIIAGGIIVLLILIIIISLVRKHKKKNIWAEDYMVPYNENDDEGFVDDFEDKKKKISKPHEKDDIQDDHLQRNYLKEADLQKENIPQDEEKIKKDDDIDDKQNDDKQNLKMIDDNKREKIKKENAKAKMERNKAKEMFLKEYDTKDDDIDNYKNPRSKKRHKGKRFK